MDYDDRWVEWTRGSLITGSRRMNEARGPTYRPDSGSSGRALTSLPSSRESHPHNARGRVPDGCTNLAHRTHESNPHQNQHTSLAVGMRQGLPLPHCRLDSASRVLAPAKQVHPPVPKAQARTSDDLALLADTDDHMKMDGLGVVENSLARSLNGLRRLIEARRRRDAPSLVWHSQDPHMRLTRRRDTLVLVLQDKMKMQMVQ